MLSICFHKMRRKNYIEKAQKVLGQMHRLRERIIDAHANFWRGPHLKGGRRGQKVMLSRQKWEINYLFLIQFFRHKGFKDSDNFMAPMLQAIRKCNSLPKVVLSENWKPGKIAPNSVLAALGWKSNSLYSQYLEKLQLSIKVVRYIIQTSIWRSYSLP